MASGAFQPLGRFSKARRSALLLLFEPVLLIALLSFFFLGRPRSMMLPVLLLLSGTLLRCCLTLDVGTASTASFEVVFSCPMSAFCSLFVCIIATLIAAFHLFEGVRRSDAEDIGVGRLHGVGIDESVLADIGVLVDCEAERGVHGVLVFGDPFVRTARLLGSLLLVLPDRSRLREVWRIIRQCDEFCPGIRSGGRSLGDCGREAVTPDGSEVTEFQVGHM